VQVIRSLTPPESPARTRPPVRTPLRVGAVQHRWHPDPAEHRAALAEGIAAAAAEGAALVCLQELTLSPYFAVGAGGPSSIDAAPEPLLEGPTFAFAAEQAGRHRVHVHASLWEADPAVAPRGYNTAIVVAPDGSLVARTRKLHIPVTAGYHEDRYFAEGDTGYPVVTLGQAHLGFPTCWDQWFPELARAYSLAGAEVLVYPTAPGSTPSRCGSR
jgi:N-carbamoylputrescine amidase